MSWDLQAGNRDFSKHLSKRSHLVCLLLARKSEDKKKPLRYHLQLAGRSGKDQKHPKIQLFSFRIHKYENYLLRNCYPSIPNVHTSLSPIKDDVFLYSHKHNKPGKAEGSQSQIDPTSVSYLERSFLVGRCKGPALGTDTRTRRFHSTLRLEHLKLRTPFEFSKET